MAARTSAEEQKHLMRNFKHAVELQGLAVAVC